MNKYKEKINEGNNNKEPTDYENDICDFCEKQKNYLMYVNDGEEMICYHCGIKKERYINNEE